MAYPNVLEIIDREILHLQQVRALMSTDLAAPAKTAGKHRGRPPKATQIPKAKRQLSDEARQRIVAAQKKRWAKQKRAKAE